jgi:outer membrane protein with beta-barrel domain
MKRSTLLALAILIYSHSFAQVNFGVKGGVTLNSIAQSSYSSSIGYNAGVLANISINPKLFFQPEAQYSVKGEHTPSNGSYSAGTLRLNYLAIPLLLGYHPINKLSIVLGPELGFLLNADSHFDNANHNVSSNFQKFDMGIDLGVTYKLCHKAGVELRYNYGFQDLEKVIVTNMSGNVISNTTIGSNRVLQLGVYYMLK